MKKRALFCAALIPAALALAACGDGREPPLEQETTISAIRITGIPDGVGILTAVLDDSRPRSRGLAAVGGAVFDPDGNPYAVSEIADGEATSPLYYGADIMLFLFALLGAPPSWGMEPPIAVPCVTSAVVRGRGDVAVYYSVGLDTLLSAGAGSRVWSNVFFLDFTENRVLTLDWNAAD